MGFGPRTERIGLSAWPVCITPTCQWLFIPQTSWMPRWFWRLSGGCLPPDGRVYHEHDLTAFPVLFQSIFIPISKYKYTDFGDFSGNRGIKEKGYGRFTFGSGYYKEHDIKGICVNVHTAREQIKRLKTAELVPAAKFTDARSAIENMYPSLKRLGMDWQPDNKPSAWYWMTTANGKQPVIWVCHRSKSPMSSKNAQTACRRCCPDPRSRSQ